MQVMPAGAEVLYELPWRDVGLSLLATAFFALLVWLVTRVGNAVNQRLAAFAKLDRAGGVGLLARRALARITSLFVWATVALAAYVWLAFVLSRFAVTHEAGATLGQSLFHGARQVVFAIGDAIPGLVMVAVIVVVTRFLSRLVAAFLDAVQRGRFKVEGLYPETVPATRRVSVVALWLGAAVIAWPYIPGSGTDAFKGLSVLVGLMLSLGGTGVINQLLSGLVIVYSRSLSEGDWVHIGDIEGKVREIGVLSVKVLTPNNREVTVPNAVVVASAIHNYDRGVDGDGTAISTTVTLGYELPWQRAHELLLSASRRVPALSPDSFVRQRAFADFAVEYELVAHVLEGKPVAEARTQLHAAMQDTFREANVQLMTPHIFDVRRTRASV